MKLYWVWKNTNTPIFLCRKAICVTLNREAGC